MKSVLRATPWHHFQKHPQVAEVRHGLWGHSSKATHLFTASSKHVCLSNSWTTFLRRGIKTVRKGGWKKTHTHFFFAALKYSALDQCGINYSQVSTPDCPALAGEGNICLPDNEHHFGSEATVLSSLTFCCVSGGWQLMQMEFSITAFYEEGNLLFTKEYQADFSKVTSSFIIIIITLSILWQN